MSATQVTAAESTKPKRLANPARDNKFFLAMAIACALGVFAGFSRTYFLRSHFTSHPLSLLLQVHGAVFTVWIVYLVIQTALITDGRISIHRRLGYAGAVLASAMVVLGIAVAYTASKYGYARPIPFAHNPEGGLFFTLVDILMFAAFVAAGFCFRRNRQAHQRMMMMSTVCALMPSALGGRLGTPNPTLLVLLFVLAGPIYDLVTLRRIHRAYYWSLLVFFLTTPPIRMLGGNSGVWYRTAHRLLQ